MRLTPEERRTILDLARRHFGEGCVVRLYGSRARDAARGGDIDLHIIATRSDRAGFMDEVRFLAELETHLGERRVDVLVRPPGHEPEPIDRIALETGVTL